MANSSKISQHDFQKLLTSISHDVKNNLTPLYLYLEILKKNVTAESDQKKLHQIEKSAKAIEQYCSTVTEISKAYFQSYIYSPKKETIQNLETAVNELVDSFEYNELSPEMTVFIDINNFKRVIKVLKNISQTSTINVTKDEIFTQLVLTVESKKNANFSVPILLDYLETMLPQLAHSYTINNKESQLTVTMNFQEQ